MKKNSLKIFSFVLLPILTFVLLSNLLPNTNVSAASTNEGNASVTYDKNTFTADYFNSRDSESEYLSMFTNSSHVFYLNNVNGSGNTANLSYGNYFTVADNDKLVLTSNADNGYIINAKGSAISTPYYVVYNNSSDTIGCVQYSVSYDNFILPIPHIYYSDATGDPLNDYSFNEGFGMFINGFRDYFNNDRVFFSRQNVNGNLPCNVTASVYLPNSSVEFDYDDENFNSYTGVKNFETNVYQFSYNGFGGNGNLGELYDDLFRNAYNGEYPALDDVYVPHVTTAKTTVDSGIIDTYYAYAFIPKLTLTFSLVNTQYEYDFAKTVCYHRTPYYYANRGINSDFNSFLNTVYNAYLRSCFGAEGQLNNEYFNAGYTDGYDNGRDFGYDEGYNAGYEEGFIRASDYSNPFLVILDIVSSFLNFEIFPEFKLYYILLFAFGISIMGVILKFAMGG